MHTAFECVRFQDKVFVYNFQDAEGGSIDSSILSAVFEGSNVPLESKLRQGMRGLWLVACGLCLGLFPT